MHRIHASRQGGQPEREGLVRFLSVLVMVALIVAGMLILASCGDDSDSDAEADGATAGQEALATVESAIAAFNAGDMDTWALWREGGQATGGDFAYEKAAEARIDVVQCSYRGLAEWQMDGPMTGHGFDCATTQTDLILGAAGIELEMTYNWVIGPDPESSQGGSNEDFSVVEGFMGEYRDWLATAHPDVASSIQYLGVLPTATSVPTLLEYVDEFVAQSDEYPLTTPVPPGDYGGPLS